MLDILLFVINIILIILVFIIISICCILFVPIRYKSNGNFKEHKLDINYHISWLFRIISVSGKYNSVDKENSFKIKIFGKDLNDFKKNKGKKCKTDKRKVKKRKNEKNNELNAVRNMKKQETEKTIKIGKQAEEAENVVSNKQSLDVRKDSSKSKKVSNEEIIEKSKNEYIMDKIIFTFKKIYDKLKKVWEIKRRIFDFLNKPENKRAFIIIKDSLIKLLKHIRPRKLKVNAHVGFEDPANTGLLTGAVAVLYSFYNKGLVFIPNFNESIIDIEYNVKGRVYNVIVLKLCLNVYFNDDCKNIYKDFIKMRR
jgi:Protein of unknown function (DUF2953).